MVNGGGGDRSRAALEGQRDRQRERSGVRELIGYRTRAWRAGYSEVELDLDAKHMNSIAVVHGGIYGMLLDVAMGHAVSYCAIKGNTRYCTTVALSTNFLHGARGGTLI